MTSWRRIALMLLVVALTGVAAATAGADDDDDGDRRHTSGFKTAQAAMLDCPSCGPNIVPIITVGDTIGSYRFEAIPDGIAVYGGGGHDDDGGHGKGRFDLLVNHETSTVPFPFNPPFAATQGEGNQNDFDNSQVSRLTLNGRNEITRSRIVITTSENYQRFCSNYLATKKEGFSRPILFTNEEAQDWVFRTGTAWPGPGLIPAGTAGAEQSGVVVAYDVRNGKRKAIYGMGRHNHENSVAIPGYRDNVVLSTDDTFFTIPVTTTNPPQSLTYNTKAWSQLYSYIADDTNDLWKDKGNLWAFVSDTPGYDDYYDFTPGDATKIKGHFIKVPKNIAKGKHSTGRDLLSTDFPGMLPPPQAGGAVVAPPPDGPQWVLDQWGNAANNTQGENAFRFVRLEDVAYDKRRGKSNIVYLVDSGRGTAGASQADRSTNGRVWKMVLNKKNPKIVESLEILIEGDDQPVKTLGEMHQPDNIESTKNSLLITEDPGSSQQFTLPTADPAATTARLWKFDLATGVNTAVASVNQGADEGLTDVDGGTTPVFGNLGSWESSGIVDASSVLGRDWFFITIQAHTLWVEKADGPDRLDLNGAPNPGTNGKDFTFKREGGQLLALKIPGA